MEDKELFDSALTDEPIKVAAEEPVTEPVNDGQPRDEHGRFTPKESEPVVAAQPEPQGKDEAHVPSWRLREVREEADRRIAEAESRWQRQFEQLQRQNQPRPEPATAPDIFENPTGAIEYGVQRAVDPIKSEVQQTREYFSRMMAEDKHGADKVQAAFDWVKQGLDRGEPEAIAAHQRAMRSMHPYGELIKAHQQQSVYQQIGSDPNAWFNKTFEERLSDPKFAAEVMQKIQGSVRGQPQSITRLPPSIGKVAAAQSASEDAGDMSDASLFAHAMR